MNGEPICNTQIRNLQTVCLHFAAVGVKSIIHLRSPILVSVLWTVSIMERYCHPVFGMLMARGGSLLFGATKSNVFLRIFRQRRDQANASSTPIFHLRYLDNGRAEVFRDLRFVRILSILTLKPGNIF
jgi:hypothetical protein